MLGLVSHSGEAFRCINMHQAGYSDTTRRELIVENLTKIILDNKSMRYIIGGDMNAASLGGRDGYSQNPATVQLRKAADEALTGFSQRISGTLISPNVPTWRRGDGTQSATLDHVILVNFPDKTIRVTAETLGDIHHDHLCLKLGVSTRRSLGIGLRKTLLTRQRDRGWKLKLGPKSGIGWTNRQKPSIGTRK